MMLFEVALIKTPTKKEMEDGALEVLVMSPTAVIANDDRSAGVKAVMMNKDKLTETDMERVQVLVRPFA
jgi:hypothetical protein